ncbi:hypothetical protein FS842_006006 [Serendipita sp. 407]|nr:hypothetical protein FRC20_001421 [Serendipita sp. 405]KAG9058669.1 hypothetical protein FS842_006006 [Serendipita sp. 407]
MDKICSELTLRIRELEKGLQDERAGHSSEPHPLLDDSLLSIVVPPTKQDYEVEDGPINFGTLMIADDGSRMKWLGSTAVSAWFLDDEAERDAAATHQYYDNVNVEPNILDLCLNFPFGTIPVDEHAKEELYGYLPSEESDAILLVERFFVNVGWLYNFVPRPRLLSMVRTLYDPSVAPLAPHRLAIIFAVFALTTLVDQHPRPVWRSSHTYSLLARAALGVESIFGTTATLATVQALSLLSLWYQLSDDSGDPSKSWGCLGLTFKVAQSIGLHRDGKIWNLGEEEAQDRRRVFWELQAVDTWQALGYGRPPSLVRPHFDCPQPFDTEESLGHPPNFHRWKHHYMSEGIMSILEHALISNSKTSSPHSIILKLDTKIRSCTIPAKLQLKDANSRNQADEMLLLQHYTSMLSKESALMYLHRGFFARAVFDPPHDPLRHRFSHSVLACFTSACQLLKGMREIIYPYSHLLNRIFGWWGHAYSSAVTLGGLVAMAPGCNLADQALKEFDAAIEMLEHGTVGPTARRVLPALKKLQTKARRNYELYKAGQWKPEDKMSAAPPEMAGLGTAVLPLAGKSTTPPRDGVELDTSPQSFQPSVPPSAHFSRRQPSNSWSLEAQQVQPNPVEPMMLSTSVSPQELAPPPHPMNDFTWAAAQTGRQGGRAQSFDDYLRMHKLQESGTLPPIQSAPSMSVALPPYLHDQFDSQSQMQHDGPRGPVWDAQPRHEPFPPQQIHAYERSNADMGYPEPMGVDPLYEPLHSEDHYNDASWKIFMDGLGL